MAGAMELRNQTLANLVRDVDMKAEERGTLESEEFSAFRDLVQSVYLGRLQKDADGVDGVRETTGGESSSFSPESKARLTQYPL